MTCKNCKMDPICNAIKANGQGCTKAHQPGGRLCGIHRNTEQNKGPNAYAKHQLVLRQKFAKNAMETDYQMRIEAAIAANNVVHVDNLIHDRVNARRAMFTIHSADLRDLHQAQQAIIAQTGVDPDAAANARRAARRQEIVARHRANMERLQAARDADAAAVRPFLNRHDIVLGDARAVAEWEQAQRVAARGLAAFAGDPQNVHTVSAVEQTKKIVQLVLQIPVPEEYRWHAVNASKTPFEIGLECGISQKAAWQMMSQYAQAISIYDIEPGIYGKVLDCVWQYTKASPDKEDLCKIIRQELQDNIGMCAQGNLSRLCNILAGYLDGVAPPESIADKLGRLLPPLADIDDPYDRFIRAVAILKENNVARNQWGSWLDALQDDDDDREALTDVLLSS